MESAREIIDRLLSDPEFRRSRVLSSGVYQDEPLLKTGADLLRERRGTERKSPATNRRTAPLPSPLDNLRAMERDPEALRQPRSWLFVKQAELAWDYEDGKLFDGWFNQTYPTYMDMTDEQLIGYFRWRSRVRRGEIKPGLTSFAYVHLYELINGIGSNDPEKRFREILAFWRLCQKARLFIDRNVRRWARDFVIFHGLDAKLLDEVESFEGADRNQKPRRIRILDSETLWGQIETHDEKRIGKLRPEDALGDLLHHDSERVSGRRLATMSLERREKAEETLFEAIASLSKHRIANSPAYEKDPEAFRIAICHAWDLLSEHYDRRRKIGLVESLFGTLARVPHPMFGSAVFYGGTHPDTVYRVSKTASYICEGGRWTHESFPSLKGPSSTLGEIMRSADRAIMAEMGLHPHISKGKDTPKYLKRIMAESATFGIAEAKARRDRRVSIDFSLLDGIRSAASATCESLLIDEERDLDDPSMMLGDSADETVGTIDADRVPDADRILDAERVPDAVESAALASLGLDEIESAYLASLLAGEPPAARSLMLTETGTYESILVDSINERLIDEIGDVVVEESDDGFALVEDYIDDLKGLLET